jgi:hypothetical protein
LDGEVSEGFFIGDELALKAGFEEQCGALPHYRSQRQECPFPQKACEGGFSHARPSILEGSFEKNLGVRLRTGAFVRRMSSRLSLTSDPMCFQFRPASLPSVCKQRLHRLYGPNPYSFTGDAKKHCRALGRPAIEEFLVTRSLSSAATAFARMNFAACFREVDIGASN